MNTLTWINEKDMLPMKSLLIAPCGINCRVCVAYLREKNKCPGCRVDDKKKPITRFRCKIKECENFKQSDAQFCCACDHFPCANLKHLDKRYRTKYNTSVIENLEYIKNSGTENFLGNEKKRWTCPECGGIICMHKGYCYSCGKDEIMKQEINSIDEYIRLFPEQIQKKLTELREAIHEEAPQAQEKISYQMPTFFLHGNLVYFAAHSKHIGFYPTASGIKTFKNELGKYKSAKGSVQFPLEEPLPIELIKRIVRFRVEENQGKGGDRKLRT